MTGKTLRKVVHIDENKCNGCGACVPSCAEGALKIVNGKAKLVSDIYCDGLGACLGECPQGAITVEERPADDFNELAAQMHQEISKQKDRITAGGCASSQIKDLHTAASEILPCGCNSAQVKTMKRSESENEVNGQQSSQLTHWPVQLTLVSANAPFLKGADVVLAADCTAYAYARFHNDFLINHALLIACPKLDDFQVHLEKLTQIIALSGLKSLTVVRMEVPCCSGLVSMAKKAVETAGNDVPLREVIISVNGEIK